MMNIYLVSRCDGGADYDEYDSFVCVCETEDEARRIHPGGGAIVNQDGLFLTEANKFPRSGWVRNIKDVSVEFIGKASNPEPRIICASFNAG